MRFSNLVFFVSIDDSHIVPLSSNAHCLSVPTTSQERANSKADGLSCPPTPLSLPRRYYSAGRNRLPWERTSRQNTIIQPQVHVGMLGVRIMGVENVSNMGKLDCLCLFMGEIIGVSWVMFWRERDSSTSRAKYRERRKVTIVSS